MAVEMGFHQGLTPICVVFQYKSRQGKARDLSEITQGFFLWFKIDGPSRRRFVFSNKFPERICAKPFVWTCQLRCIHMYIYISKWQTCPQSGLAALLGCPQANRCNNPWILKYIQNMPDRHGDCFGVLNKQGIHRKRPLTRSLKSRRYGFIGHDLF